MSGEIYRTKARLVHLFGLHVRSKHYSVSPQCDWCGHRSKKQREIAARNFKSMHVEDSR